jgi:brefeldin A-resistance guanine nucleotide exchange factor 1
MLSPELASSDHREWTAIFGEVLFPLISQLMKPEVYHSDPVGMSETRVQAATLLCKIFLHYLVLLSEWEGMLELWLRILDVMDRLMHSGQGDSLVCYFPWSFFRPLESTLTFNQEEAVPESLKNILLVMHNGQVLVPPEEDASKAQLWNDTWARLERFLPGMKSELFPEVTPAEKEATEGKEEKKEVKLEGKREKKDEKKAKAEEGETKEKAKEESAAAADDTKA